MAALIGRIDRRGRMLWSLPKGHIELGETAEQTAIREVAEETGIQGSVLAALGSIDYWFVTEGRRVHKTVHHYLMRFLGGELSDDDVEVSEVAWVPLGELPSRLAYADERRLAEVAGELIDRLHADGPAALPPLPRSLAAAAGPDALAHPQPPSRRTRATPTRPADERLRTRAVINTGCRECGRAAASARRHRAADADRRSRRELPGPPRVSRVRRRSCRCASTASPPKWSRPPANPSSQSPEPC